MGETRQERRARLDGVMQNWSRTGHDTPATNVTDPNPELDVSCSRALIFPDLGTAQLEYGQCEMHERREGKWFVNSISLWVFHS